MDVPLDGHKPYYRKATLKKIHVRQRKLSSTNNCMHFCERKKHSTRITTSKKGRIKYTIEAINEEM